MFIAKFDGGAIIGHSFSYFVSSFPHILNSTFGTLYEVDYIYSKTVGIMFDFKRLDGDVATESRGSQHILTVLTSGFFAQFSSLGSRCEAFLSQNIRTCTCSFTLNPAFH